MFVTLLLLLLLSRIANDVQKNGKTSDRDKINVVWLYVFRYVGISKRNIEN